MKSSQCGSAGDLKGWESWKQITGYENYEVSSWGQVRNVKTKRVLKLIVQESGYCYASLYERGLYRKVRVHKLVATAFLENPSGFPVVSHLNNCKTDNKVENLKWVTHSENVRAAIADDLCKKRKPLNQKEVEAIRKAYEASSLSQRRLAKLFNTSRGTIVRILRGTYEAYETSCV